MDCLYKYTVFRAKKSEIRRICTIPNVNAHTIGIVFASSKPIGIEYCFYDVWIKRLRLNGARLKDWIYWWIIEFIQFIFSIVHQWRKYGYQRVYELGMDQLLSIFLFHPACITGHLPPAHVIQYTMVFLPELIFGCGCILIYCLIVTESFSRSVNGDPKHPHFLL